MQNKTINATPERTLKDKKHNEVIRKLIHISSLVFPLFYRYVLGYNRKLMFFILIISLAVSLGVELYRLQTPSFHKLFQRLFGQILRSHERQDFTGSTFMIFSYMLCVVFLNPVIAFLAMSYLSIGDTFAAVIGMSFGKRKFLHQNKSLEGSLACFVSILIFSIFFGRELSPWVYVTGCLAATMAELWIARIDDNIKIPLLSGLAMTLAHIFV